MGDYKRDIDGSFVRDFAQRTLSNFDYIEAHYRDGSNDVYNVTQLVNSLMGLLIFPKEQFWNNLHPIPLYELRSIGIDVHPSRWTYEIREDTYTERCDNLKTLIRHMRNALAHCNIEFYAQDSANLTGITLIDENRRGERWCAYFSFKWLRPFIRWFIEGVISSRLLTEPIEHIKAIP